MKLIYFLKQETRDQLLSIAKSAYAYFFVNKLLKYGTKEQRKTIFSQAFEGRVRANFHERAEYVLNIFFFCRFAI